MALFDEQQTDEKLHSLHLKEEEDLVRILAQKYAVAYTNLDTVAIDASAVSLVAEAEAREAELAVIQTVGKKIKVAVRNPATPAVEHVLEKLKHKQYEPELFLVSRNSLEKAWALYKDVSHSVPVEHGVVALDDDTSSPASVSQLAEALAPLVAEREERDTSNTLEIILEAAIALEASDVHIEPGEASTRLRLRLDGVLQNVLSFNPRVYALLLSRIKLLSDIKLNVKNRAQDGRFTIRTSAIDMEVRTSTLPGPHGESIVLRILNPKTIALSLSDLGMQQPVYDMIAEELKKPNGMILTTGPTGSGKTTTLYAFIKELASTRINIITIEDPIEYHIAGITQTQVDDGKGYDFSNGLRSILRQDPDIILVGEIRDKETAETAMHAALTGHLVFSTLHTNNAPGTIPRLIDLGVQPNIIAPAINTAMAQRLVRRLCMQCRKAYTPDKQELEHIQKELQGLPAPYKKPDMHDIQLWRAEGCSVCNNTGYKGRIGIFEIFRIDDPLERLILERPSEAAVRAAAEKQGMLTIQQDGILKMLAGLTTWDEIERVTGE